MTAKKETAKKSTGRSKSTRAPKDSKKSSKAPKLSPSAKYDIIKGDDVYIRTLKGSAAGSFCEKMNGQAVARAKSFGRKSYVKCVAVPTSKDTRFHIRYQVIEENDRGERTKVEKKRVFKTGRAALDFAHQIPDTPVTLL